MTESSEELFGAIEEWAARTPGQIALASQRGYMNYEDLAGNIASAAFAASGAGIGPGHLVVVGVGSPDMALILTLALMRIGCRVGYTRDFATYASSGVGIDAVIADDQTPPTGHKTVTVDPRWFAGAQARWINLPPPAAYASLIISSSGSTGRPKLIENPLMGVLHRLKVRREAFFVPRARTLALFGARTIATFADDLTSLVNGGVAIRAVDRNIQTVLDTIQLFVPDHLTMPPSMLHGLLQTLAVRPTDIRKVRALRTAGAYCAPHLQMAALEQVADDVMSSFGSNETGWIAFSDARDDKAERSVGRIFDDVDVAVFDGEGQRLPQGTEGEIWAKGPDGTAGFYIGNDADQGSAFKDGWFRTGDIGMVDENRNLIFRGRATNVIINIGGSKISPEGLEEHISTMPNIVEVGVTGVDVPEGYEKICAAVVSSSNPSIEAVNAHLARLKQPWPIQELRLVDAVPRTGNGKIDRVALKRLCAEQATASQTTTGDS